MNDPSQKPLKVDEIEALLRSARNLDAGRADVVSNEPLGPGDVQHLRNTDLPDDLLIGGWPYDSASTDELLHRAENHLAEAMSSADGSPLPAPPTRPRAFSPLASSSTPFSSAGLAPAVIGDIELDVTLELGRAELKIEELLALREGSVVTLDKQAGEPIDILANGKLIARGEVIVVDNKFCVRICEVVGLTSR
jgi:flagellar motor switch protein FliN/FliY